MEVRKERKRWGRRGEGGREEEDSIEIQTDDWERVLENSNVYNRVERF